MKSKRLKCKSILFCIIFGFLFSGCEKKEELIVSSKENHTFVEQDASEDEKKRDKNTEILKNTKTISVYVCGEVKRPGVYSLKADARINDAVECAGGMTKKADCTAINLASLLTDEQQIIIPKKGKIKENRDCVTRAQTETAGSENSSKININKATKEELMKLTGIGQSRAEAIIAYRQEQREFQKIEDIMNVSGIKEAAFSKIKEQITVNE